MNCWDTLTSNRRRRLTLVTALSVATFPEEREAKRQALLDKVESLRDIIASGEEEAEDIGTLPQGTVDAIHEAGLFAYKSAKVLGGAEADVPGSRAVVVWACCLAHSV